MHAHDASCRAAPRCASVYVRIAHGGGHGAHEWVRLNRTWKESFIPGLWRLSTACFLLLHFLLFSSWHLSFYCTLTLLLSLSQCRKPSAAFSTRLGKMRTLRRTNRVVLPVLHCQEVPVLRSARLGIQYSPVSVHVTYIYEILHVSANWHSWAWQSCTYVGTLRE